MVATWPNFAKKHAIICLEALLFLISFTDGFSSRKAHTADCCFISGSYWYTQFRLLLQCPKCEDTFLRQIFLAHGFTSPPYPLLLFTQVMEHRTGTTFPYAKAVVRLPHEIFMISCISAYVIFGSFLIRDCTLETFSGVIDGHCHSITTVIVFQRSRSRHKLFEPPENSGFGLRLISKTEV